MFTATSNKISHASVSYFLALVRQLWQKQALGSHQILFFTGGGQIVWIDWPVSTAAHQLVQQAVQTSSLVTEEWWVLLALSEGKLGYDHRASSNIWMGRYPHGLLSYKTWVEGTGASRTSLPTSPTWAERGRSSLPQNTTPAYLTLSRPFQTLSNRTNKHIHQVNISYVSSLYSTAVKPWILEAWPKPQLGAHLMRLLLLP